MVTDTAIMSSIPILLTGTLATGVFQPNPADPLNSLRIGTPFTARPEKFTGYYKYTSVNNDSFDIYAILSEWDTINNERTIIGTAMFTDSLTVSSYTKFDLDFQYYKSFTPDTISVVFASSAAGDLFLGSVGSTLFIDEIALELPVGIKIPLMPEINIIAYPNPASDQIIFKTDKVLTNGRLFIYNSEGKEIHALNFLNNITTIDLAGFNKGIYYYQLLDGNSLMNAGDFIVK